MTLALVDDACEIDNLYLRKSRVESFWAIPTSNGKKEAVEIINSLTSLLLRFQNIAIPSTH